MCSSSLTAMNSGEQAPLQQPLWLGTRRRFGMDPAEILFKTSWFGQIRDISATAPLQAKGMGLNIWTQNTSFAVLDLSRTRVCWISVTQWPSAWESRLSHCWSICTRTGIYLDSHRLRVWTLLLGANRDSPQALARDWYSLTPLADEGEGRFYSEDTLNSIHPLNSTLSFRAYIGSIRKRNFHSQHAEMLIHSCSLQFTTLTGILLPSSISFDPDLPLFTP